MVYLDTLNLFLLKIISIPTIRTIRCIPTMELLCPFVCPITHFSYSFIISYSNIHRAVCQG